eukprot:TRINITY_DN62111_c0_g1_i1.p1 TRINITY_DN62111_c0_g1~~TRINITY_DN62111_c0_g1_i1.p1  ORF type:complete len:923 (+),score=130.52 TRINITY_DN62111_c0_g1_i1:94-2862(+)
MAAQKNSSVGIYVKEVQNLPESFRGFGLDEKGALSPNPADHVFRYELCVHLPDETEVRFATGRFGVETSEEGTETMSIVFPPGSPDDGKKDEEDAAPPPKPTGKAGKAKKMTKAEEEEERKRKEEEERKRKEEEERKRKEEEERRAAELENGEEDDNPLPLGSIVTPLPPEVQQALEGMADTETPVPITFRRILRSNLPPDTTDVNANRYKAEGLLSLNAFLEPGLAMCDFVVPLKPCPPPAEPVEDAAPSRSQSSAKKPPPKKAAKKKDTLPTLTQEEDGSGEHPYVEHGTNVVITLNFSKPLVYLPEHRPRPNLKPDDIIPRRAKPQKRPVSSTQLYSEEIKKIVLSLADEWKATRTAAEANQSIEAQQQAFMDSLKGKGLHSSFQEKLKFCVVKIVKEQFNKQPNATKQETQTFCNKLYVYLLDNMHKTVNELFSRQTLALQPSTVNENQTHNKWKRLADEAELMKQYSLAAKYHQERLVHEAEDPTESAAEDVWNEYGQFCLRVRDIAKAEHAFREAIALNLNHLPSLITYGLLLLSKKFFTEAEVFLQAAVDVDVESVLSWSCLGLFMEVAAQNEEDEYRQKERLKEAMYSYNQAKRLLQSATDPPIVCGKPTTSVYIYLADFLLDIHFEHLADHTLANQLKREGQCVASDLLTGRMHFQQENFEKAEEYLKSVIKTERENVRAYVLLGDVYRELSRPSDAEQSYDRALAIAEKLAGGFDDIEKIDGVNGPVYVFLGNILMTMNRYQDANDAYLLAARIWPCGLTWMGVGIAYYRLEDYEHAEQALNESNILNNLNPTTWAYLCLVCLKTGRLEEADHAFNQALKQNLTNADVISEIGEEQQALGRVLLAEAAFQRSLKHEDKASTHMQLANTLTAMRRFEDARKEYAAVVAKALNDTQRDIAIEKMLSIDELEKAQ